MALKAKKLFQDMKASGWKPGMPLHEVRKLEWFEELSESCGCDTEGRAIYGKRAEMHLGEDSDGFTVRDLFENLVVDSHGDPVGRAFVNEFFDSRSSISLQESGAMDAVNSTGFTATMGQLLVLETLKPYEQEQYILRKMFTTKTSPFEQEKIIGMAPPSDPDDADLVVQEGEHYQMQAFGDAYKMTPLTKKRGRIIGLTKEAVYFNRTGDIIEQAAGVGDLLAYNEERECYGVFLGHVNPYNEKLPHDAAAINLDTYQIASAGSGAGQLAYAYSTRPYPFVNDVPDNPLDDYTAIEVCDKYFARIVDPYRGRPIMIGKPFVFGCYEKRINIPRVLEAQNIWKLTQQGTTSAGAVFTQGPNPIGHAGMTPDQVAVSKLLQQELVRRFSISADLAKEIWFYGDIPGAFGYMENWPLQVVSAPANSDAEFNQDIVLRWKASKRGVAYVRDPRKVLRVNFTSTGSSA